MASAETARRYERTLEELRAILLNIQQIKSRIIEIEKALKELDKTSDENVYRALGNILLRVSKANITRELNDEKEILNIKLNELERREKLLRDRLKSLERQLGVTRGAPETAG